MSRLDEISEYRELLGRFAHFAGEALCETLWPTRCAICDLPGKVLCERCERSLPYLDLWRACPHCGAAFGLHQCDFCNNEMLARLGLEELPFEACASAAMFDGETGRIVRTLKDAGEQRLAHDLARIMARAVPPAWPIGSVTFVPATLAAYRYRGFDHAQLIARDLAAMLGVPCIEALQRPRSRDQRRLSARSRIENLGEAFRPLDGLAPHRAVLLVDDVLTTGATLCAASAALKAAGFAAVYCMTFARV